MAKRRTRKPSTLDSAAIAAGSALGALTARIDRLTSQREAITTQLQRLVGQAQAALTTLASGENPFPFRARKARKKAAPKQRQTKAKSKASKKP